MSNYRYQIENYHSIKKADIAIDGITVLAGVNGAGKSTLARWLYYIVNISHSYEYTRFREYIKSINELISQYEVVQKDIADDTDLSENLSIAKQSILDMHYTKMAAVNKIMNVYAAATDHFVDILRASFHSMNKNNKVRVLNYLQIENIEGESDDDLLNRFQTIQLQKAESIRNRFIQLQKNRPIEKFYESIKRLYSEVDFPKTLSFQEDGVEIINDDKIGNLFGLEDAIYIDTPMALSVTESNNPFWKDLRLMLRNNTEETEYDDVARGLLSQLRDITGGKVTDKKDIVGKDELYFTRKSDNLIVKLENMATGIKTFAYLDRLLENGFLIYDTILILDEPEAHLHPQWIVEFARMLVRIHKDTGLYIMLASHDPDMVSAIRYVAEAEGVLDRINFYLAEQDNESQSYIYRALGNDIEPIFASFNKSFELIEKYGVDNG